MNLPSDTPNEMTQKAFAQLLGISPPMVVKHKGKGRLVMNAAGDRVVVRESIARIQAARDPARGGDRNATAGPVPAVAAPVATSAAPELEPEDLNYQREAARDKRASARQRELDLAKAAGELVPAADVEQRIAHHVRQALDHLASRRRRLAPKLALEADPRKVEQLLEESDREFCLALAGLATSAKGDEALAA